MMRWRRCDPRELGNDGVIREQARNEEIIRILVFTSRLDSLSAVAYGVDDSARIPTRMTEAEMVKYENTVE